jgi:hypothetical protein
MSVSEWTYEPAFVVHLDRSVGWWPLLVSFFLKIHVKRPII